MQQQVIESTLVAEKSTHKVPVFPLKELRLHPNADKMKIIDIDDTAFTYCGNTEQWKDRVGSLVAWIPPDSLIDLSRPEFAGFTFLQDGKTYDENSQNNGKYCRVRAKRLRGVVSYGILVPAPEGLKAGDDAAKALDVHHFNPIDDSIVVENKGKKKLNIGGGEKGPSPSGISFKYDVDSFMAYAKRVMIQGEPVAVTEKMHGRNGKYVFSKGVFFKGSRDEWKLEYNLKPTITLEELLEFFGEEEKEKALHIYERHIVNWKPTRSVYWRAIDDIPGVEQFCREHEGFTVYGEVIGEVGGYDYGLKQGEVSFRSFDILRPNGQWFNFKDFMLTCEKFKIPTAPLLAVDFPYDLEKLTKMAEGNSTLGNHIREGVVVCPMEDRWDARLGRVKLKIINPEYLEESKKKKEKVA